MSVLDIDRLNKGFPTLSKATSSSLAEAAVFCLQHHSHSPGVKLIPLTTDQIQYQLQWKPISDPALEPTYADKVEAVEKTASAVGILAGLHISGGGTVRRSARGSGVDYWIPDPSKDEHSTHHVQDRARLEISGIFSGNSSDVRTRVKQKEKQVKKSDYTGLPVIIIVVEFSQPIIGIKNE